MYTYHHTRGANGRFESKLLTPWEINEQNLNIGRKLYARLIELDPVHGEAWFDDETNVPSSNPQIVTNDILRRRIAELEAAKVDTTN